MISKIMELGNIALLLGVLLLLCSGCTEFIDDVHVSQKEEVFMEAYHSLNSTYMENRSMGPSEVLSKIIVMEEQIEKMQENGENTSKEEELYSQIIDDVELNSLIPKIKTDEYAELGGLYAEYAEFTSGNWFAVDWESSGSIVERMEPSIDTLKRRGYSTSLEEELVRLLEMKTNNRKEIYGGLLAGLICDGSESEHDNLEMAIQIIDSEMLRLHLVLPSAQEELREMYGYDVDAEIREAEDYMWLHYETQQKEDLAFLWVMMEDPIALCSKGTEGTLKSIEMNFSTRLPCPVEELQYYALAEFQEGGSAEYEKIVTGGIGPNPDYTVELIIDEDRIGEGVECRNPHVLVQVNAPLENMEGFDLKWTKNLPEFEEDIDPGLVSLEIYYILTECNERTKMGYIKSIGYIKKNEQDVSVGYISFNATVMNASGELAFGEIGESYPFEANEESNRIVPVIEFKETPLRAGNYTLLLEMERLSGSGGIIAVDARAFEICGAENVQ